jgi:hypothetical protein
MAVIFGAMKIIEQILDKVIKEIPRNLQRRSPRVGPD